MFIIILVQIPTDSKLFYIPLKEDNSKNWLGPKISVRSTTREVPLAVYNSNNQRECYVFYQTQKNLSMENGRLTAWFNILFSRIASLQPFLGCRLSFFHLGLFGGPCPFFTVWLFWYRYHFFLYLHEPMVGLDISF